MCVSSIFEMMIAHDDRILQRGLKTILSGIGLLLPLAEHQICLQMSCFLDLPRLVFFGFQTDSSTVNCHKSDNFWVNLGYGFVPYFKKLAFRKGKVMINQRILRRSLQFLNTPISFISIHLPVMKPGT